MLAGLGAGIILWGLYFALGFRAFCRGMQASTLGLTLTIGMPLLVYLLCQAGWPVIAALLPPGAVYFPVSAQPSWTWLVGPLLGVTAALMITRRSLAWCLGDLRHWCDLHHGRKVLE